MAGYIDDWILGFDHGWDHEKFGDTFEPVDRPSYRAGWRTGVDQFRAAMADLELVRIQHVDEDWQPIGHTWEPAQ